MSRTIVSLLTATWLLIHAVPGAAAPAQATAPEAVSKSQATRAAGAIDAAEGTDAAEPIDESEAISAAESPDAPEAIEGVDAPNAPKAPDATTPTADTAPPSSPLEEVVITGEHPGPSLWKITHGGTNVVWVLGTTGPIPKEVKWRSRQVEDVIAHSQAVIFGESVKPTNIGFFRGLLLLRSVLKARYNPDKAVLKDLITPDRYARWLALRKKYLKDDDDYDRVRPMFIALQLVAAATKAAGLSSEANVGRIVATTAKKHDVPVRDAEVKLNIDDPKQAIRDFTATPREKDLACFIQTLDHLESDLEKTKARASAWAVGDIETYRQLPKPVVTSVCLEAITSAPGLQDEVTKIKEGLDDAWLWEVQKALELNQVTLAVTSLDDVLSPTGRLATLRQRGYTIEAP